VLPAAGSSADDAPGGFEFFGGIVASIGLTLAYEGPAHAPVSPTMHGLQGDAI
jgi:hypothetical protein